MPDTMSADDNQLSELYQAYLKFNEAQREDAARQGRHAGDPEEATRAEFQPKSEAEFRSAWQDMPETERAELARRLTAGFTASLGEETAEAVRAFEERVRNRRTRGPFRIS